MNMQAVHVIRLKKEGDWPSPFTIGKPHRLAAERQQRLQSLTLDLGGPVLAAAASAAAVAASLRWPGPAPVPEGPTSTSLAEAQRLANLLAIEEDAHVAQLAVARSRWIAERREAAIADQDQVTLVERRRLVNQQARWRRRRERWEREEEERLAHLPPAFDKEAQTTDDARAELPPGIEMQSQTAGDERAELLAPTAVRPLAVALTTVRARPAREDEAASAQEAPRMPPEVIDALAHRALERPKPAETQTPAPTQTVAATTQTVAAPAVAPEPSSADAAAPVAAAAAATAPASPEKSAGLTVVANVPDSPVSTVSAPPSAVKRAPPGNLDLNSSVDWVSLSRAIEEGPGQSLGSGPLALEAAQIERGKSIAEGAFAEVFRGLLWGQRVAVKQLKTDREGADKESLERELRHETRILAALSHPCILTLIGYTAQPAQIVLEVLDGTVYDLVRKHGTEQCDGGMLGPLIDILSGCAYLHACKPPLLHRDLKPPNVLHDEKLRCKLCDFGTALELKPPPAPQPTEWIGSQLYVAPEVDKGLPYGLPADVFSFGVLAYELYHLKGTGVDFYGDGDLFEGGGLFEGLEVIRAPILKETPELPVRPSACDADPVWELLGECLAFDPGKRPTFAQAAQRMGVVRQAASSTLTTWLGVAKS